MISKDHFAAKGVVFKQLPDIMIIFKISCLLMWLILKGINHIITSLYTFLNRLAINAEVGTSTPVN